MRVTKQGSGRGFNDVEQAGFGGQVGEDIRLRRGVGCGYCNRQKSAVMQWEDFFDMSLHVVHAKHLQP